MRRPFIPLRWPLGCAKPSPISAIPSPPTYIVVDYKVAHGITTNTIEPKRTKSIDMQYHWLRNRVHKGEFIVIWRKGTYNLADFSPNLFRSRITKPSCIFSSVFRHLLQPFKLVALFALRIGAVVASSNSSASLLKLEVYSR